MIQIGSCPTCGAPIYSPGPEWIGIMPPPISYTCSCHSQAPALRDRIHTAASKDPESLRCFEEALKTMRARLKQERAERLPPPTDIWLD